MKRLLLSFSLLGLGFSASAQNFWVRTKADSNTPVFENKRNLKEVRAYKLDMPALLSVIRNAPEKLSNVPSNIIVDFPTLNGSFESYRIFSHTNMDPALAARYPDIRAFVGESLNHPGNDIYFSTSELGIQTMELRADKSATFIEPYAKDLSTYVLFSRADKSLGLSNWECKVIDNATPQIVSAEAARPNADDAYLRTMRLAMSCTGEYGVYFGGTKAGALAAINNTMTRCNGVFEKDFGTRLILIANTDAVIYTNASTDPYSAASGMSSWNSQLQSTLTSVIGEANYDIGHLFGASGGGGNAGCIGCVCVNGSKGSGITSPADGIPQGDNFDIDYVAHEMGHQMGGNHTFTHSNEGTGVQVEPGSGSTIMGYAGITTKDIQAHSDPFFHAVTIQQVTNNLKAKTCPVKIATGNSIPTANAGSDYTIPKSTPFMLTGTASDADGDALTYIWEEMDNQTTSAAPSATKTTGVNFRSWTPSTSPTRYFPTMSSVLANSTTTAGSEITVEALSSVARTLNFRFTVRDNRSGGPANNSDDMIVSVNATAGPFAVTAPNTAVSYAGGSSQTVTWSVAGTTANGVNCANVDILISTNGGSSWSTLLAGTPNDGSQDVTIPNTPSTTCRIMIKGSNHIFFDISNTNFTITAGSTDTLAPTAPTLSASGTTTSSTNLSWSGATDNVGVTGYQVYQNGVLIGTVTGTSYSVTGLSSSTTYSFTVKALDAAGNVSASSNTVNVTTLTPAPDTQAPTAPTVSASGTTTSSTNLSWSGATDNIGVTGYQVYQNGVLIATVTGTSYTVTGLAASTTYSFSIKALDAAGNASVSSNTVSVTTLTNSVSYCTAGATNTADERIAKVVFSNINNSSTGTAGYEDFTSINGSVNKGSSYTIQITPYWAGTKYKEGYAVYIDYNGDGDFADSGEKAWSKSASTTTPVSGTITIPTTATVGSTRMRVIMKYNSTPSTSCGSFTYGQVEDYTLTIGGTGKVDIVPVSKIEIYPNPVVGNTINIKGLTKDVNYSIISSSGQTISKGRTQNYRIQAARLSSGMYMLQLQTAEGVVSKRFVKE